MSSLIFGLLRIKNQEICSSRTLVRSSNLEHVNEVEH
jgi:hypothetical protein